MEKEQRKKKWSIVVTNTHYIKTPEKDEICGTDPALLEAFEHLHFQWIGADEFIRRLAHTFTDFVHYENAPVVSKVVKNGLSAYATVLGSSKHQYPHERLRAFLAGCFSEAFSICKFEVVDSLDGERWSFQHEVPLSLWRFNRKELSVQQDETPTPAFSETLYRKVVPENMKHAMRRFNHEAAILAGDMANRH